MRILLTTIAVSIFASILSTSLAERITKPISMIGSFVQLRLTHNSGIAFSLALPASIQTALIVVALILVCIAAFKSSKKDHLTQVAYGLIIGGALGNITDRLPDGLVTDVVAVGTFPIFNLADIFICIGAGLLIVDGMCLSANKKAPR